MGKGQKKGGKKHKRNKNRDIETTTIRFKEDGQEYAQITKCKGNCRFDVKCSDGKDRAAILCGTMRKRKFVNLNDIVLVSLRDFQDDLCDIMDSYDENKQQYIHILHDKGTIGVFLKGFFGYNSNPNWIELFVWIATLIFGFRMWSNFYLKTE